MCAIRKALLLFLSFAFILAAAEPPADVDVALRDRVQSFYQLQADKKFRQAEDFVAADTKDYYYDSEKTAIKGPQIVKIEYAPGFQTATVTLKAKRMMLVPPAPPFEIETTFPSDWKLENGKWCWYFDPSKPIETPFGKIYPQKTAPNGNPMDAFSKMKGKVSAQSLANGVHASPERIHLDPDNPTPQTITLTNSLPGPVTVKLPNPSPALQVAIANPNLAANATTTVTITPAATTSRRPAQLLLEIAPIGQTLKIDLDYSSGK